MKGTSTWLAGLDKLAAALVAAVAVAATLAGVALEAAVRVQHVVECVAEHRDGQQVYISEGKPCDSSSSNPVQHPKSE